MTDALVELLGGATRTRTRVRGFASWQPQADTLQLLERVRAVLGEYEDYLPLTIRQIFYRLVGVHEYEKTERAYKRLCENLNRARRARLIPMSTIRDDGGTVIAPSNVWDSAKEFLATAREQAKRVQLDRTRGQSTRLVVFCEAGGMAPQLARVANPYGVTVMSGGGFDSLTDKHNFAAELASHERPTEVLHIGDHDPSGVSMFLAFLEDVEAFTRDLGGCATFTRLAVTPDQIRQYGLPTAPPKDTDKRAFNGLTCQAEALAPDVLAQILRDAIESRIDRDVLNRVRAREKTMQCQLLNQLRSTP
jgi:rhodanese-related sulfurtransferase